jgi:hypothetical protein
MRELFAHEIAVELAPTGDERAIGGAVAKELCGHWDHEGPCMWPHLVTVSTAGAITTARVLFACHASEEADVRQRILRAVHSGQCDGPNGHNVWQVRGASTTQTTAEERSSAAKWITKGS